jgi:flagellar hook-associated protein 2
VGDASAPQPLLITSSQNQITNVVQGVTIDIHGVSNAPVTLTVARNADDLVKQINSFADTFNQLVDQMDGLTSYDSDTRQRGLLLGDSTMQEVQTAVYNALQSALPEAGRFRTLGDVGITLVDGAKVSFDEDKFRQAFATDSTAVTRLFSLSTKDGTGKLVQSGLASKIESALNKLTDPVDGVLTRENKTLDLQTQQFKDRMEQLDALLDAKRTRLEYQFAHLESVLAGLQSQQNALSSLTSMSYSSSSSSKKSS